MRVLVTDGAGPLGRALVPRLLADGHDVVVLPGPSPLPIGARSVPAEPTALRGVDVVLHATRWGPEPRPAARVLGALRGAAAHLVLAVPVATRRRAAWVPATGGGWTQQRVTVLHERLDAAFASLARGGVLAVPRGVAAQPVAASEAAARLAALVKAGPAGRVPDLGGPEVADLVDLAEAWRQVRAPGLRLVPLPVPRRLAAQLPSGTTPDRAVGVRTWEAHLAGAGAATVGAGAGAGAVRSSR